MTKGQALADFIVEFTYSNTAEITRTVNSTEVVKAAAVSKKENSVPIEGEPE